VDEDLVEVHAALPMRYYLHVEMAAGIRLAANGAPTPTFTSDVPAPRTRQVVFVATTSMPSRKDYGADRFAQVASDLIRQAPGDWRFTLVTPPGIDVDDGPWRELPATVRVGVDATGCLDLFARAELVIGNDTGLTHLAALTRRPDGTGP